MSTLYLGGLLQRASAAAAANEAFLPWAEETFGLEFDDLSLWAEHSIRWARAPCLWDISDDDDGVFCVGIVSGEDVTDRRNIPLYLSADVYTDGSGRMVFRADSSSLNRLAEAGLITDMLMVSVVTACLADHDSDDHSILDNGTGLLIDNGLEEDIVRCITAWLGLPSGWRPRSSRPMTAWACGPRSPLMTTPSRGLAGT